ncbi:MAG: hypothetical protein HOV97_20370 [Nonomuraea sp.]|nr:hypothetical protein [Nonomuraea sp.]
MSRQEHPENLAGTGAVAQGRVDDEVIRTRGLDQLTGLRDGMLDGQSGREVADVTDQVLQRIECVAVGILTCAGTAVAIESVGRPDGDPSPDPLAASGVGNPSCMATGDQS